MQPMGVEVHVDGLRVAPQRDGQHQVVCLEALVDEPPRRNLGAENETIVATIPDFQAFDLEVAIGQAVACRIDTQEARVRRERNLAFGPDFAPGPIEVVAEFVDADVVSQAVSGVYLTIETGFGAAVPQLEIVDADCAGLVLDAAVCEQGPAAELPVHIPQGG